MSKCPLCSNIIEEAQLHQRVEDLYKEGNSIERVSAATGIPKHEIKAILWRRGVSLRDKPRYL